MLQYGMGNSIMLNLPVSLQNYMSKPAVNGILRLQSWVEPLYDTTEAERNRYDQVKDTVKLIVWSGKIGANSVSTQEGSGITYTWKLAKDCYIKGILAGTVQFASTAVERAINLDVRMRSARTKQLRQLRQRNSPNPTDWLTLMPHNLREARTYKIPVEKLLDENESIEKGDPLPTFIDRRNRIAHGDYSGYLIEISNPLPDGQKYKHEILVNIPEADALDQLRKCSAFIETWVAGNPRIIGLTH
jgi:hypothetical protein